VVAISTPSPFPNLRKAVMPQKSRPSRVTTEWALARAISQLAGIVRGEKLRCLDVFDGAPQQQTSTLFTDAPQPGQ
ncbi:MAG: hypothetical protein PHH32_01220, partial [Eubacteriales bacterium]|nr:hypothetical protein [Eubacteriales bacterium]